MYLKNLYLKNFRNYVEAEVSFASGLNVFFGNNAQGKTNLLEAIYLIATGRSFRTQTLNELIRHGESFFVLEAEVESETIQLYFDGQSKRLKIGSNQYDAFHPLLGTLPTVLHTPYDRELITGAPSERRRLMNLHLAQSDPLYVHHFTRFSKAMKQRNCLLRAKQTETIECWEQEMGHAAGYIAKARQKLIDELKEPLAAQGKKLSNDQETYTLTFELSQHADYLAQLQKNRKREMDLGLTLHGPHRDDLSLLINQVPARLFASEGQNKTATCALRLAEWLQLSKRIETPALLGIDDLDPHLDDTRQKLFRENLGSFGQVFITTPHSQTSIGHPIYVKNGAVQSQEK